MLSSNNDGSGLDGSAARSAAAAQSPLDDFGPTIIDIPSDFNDALAHDVGGSGTDERELVERGGTRPRRSKATDVVVEPATVTDSQGPEHEEGSETDERQPLAMQERVEVRRMGDVYPIMKNSIYADEECAEEIKLGTMDCGGRFIRYVSGLFQFLVRNPKTMGFLFTTAILLLFFKYSQQIVVRSVNSALNTHPGLEPSDELRSGVIAFTTEMLGFESAARTLQWAYLHDKIIGYDLATAAGTTFMALVASLQKSLSANQQTYVLYQIPASKTTTGVAQWGQIGCLDAADHLDGDPLCFHIAADGTAVGFRGSNTSDVIFNIPKEYADNRVQALSELTAITPNSAAAVNGVWSRPLVVTEPFYNTTYRVIGYILPIAFDTHANLFVGVDVSVQHMASAVSVNTANIDIVVADSEFMSEEGGQFVLDTFDPSLYWETMHGVTETPTERVNEIARPIFRHHGHTLMVNASFYEDGLIYQSLTMMNRWALLASSPMVLSAAETEAAFRSLLNEYERVTAVASQAFTECQWSAEQQSDNVFLEAVGRFEEVFGSRVHSLYVAYTLEETPQQEPGLSSSSSSSSSSGSSGSSSANSCRNCDSSSSSASSSFTESRIMSSASSSDSSSALVSSQIIDSSGSSSGGGSSDSSRMPAQPSSSSFSSLAGLQSSSAASEAGSDSVSDAEGSEENRLFSGAHAILEAATEADGDAGTETTATAWGSCGCSYSGSNDTTTYQCFYTDGNGLETLFNGSVRSIVNEVRHLNFSSTRRNAFIHEQILAANTTNGFWTTPYSRYDTLTSENINAMSFVLPFRFSANGTVTAAAVFDLTMDWIPEFVNTYTHSGTTGVLLMDRRGMGTIMGSRGFRVDQIYPVMATPNQTINALSKSVYDRAGASFDRAISFHEGPQLINYQLIEPYWGIIEQIPADVALDRFLPTPEVTGATDALRLIPTGETIGLFLYVAGILLCYFLNLLILGCSKLGKQQRIPPPVAGATTTATADATAISRSAASSDAGTSAVTSPRTSARR